MMMNKTYSELITIPSFEERLAYLKLNSKIGVDTFGFDRYLNQKFYNSREWRRFRDEIIIRDNACDLACQGYDIFGKIIIHHLNPIQLIHLERMNIDVIMNRENVICVSMDTHNIIHFGGDDRCTRIPMERTKYDTCPWKIGG